MNQATDHPTLARSGATVATVTELLRLLADSVPDISLLHGRDNFRSELWRGDVDLLVVGEADRFFEGLGAAAAALGFLPALQIPRVFNTVEIDLVFDRAESWTAVLVDANGAIINLDVVFVSRRPGLSTEPATLGVAHVREDVEGTYLALKRIRKGERQPDAWRSVADKLEGHESLLQGSLGSALAAEIEASLSRGDVPSASVIRRARVTSHVRRFFSGDTPRRSARGMARGRSKTEAPARAVRCAFRGRRFRKIDIG